MAENRISVISERSYRFQGYFDIRSTYRMIMEYVENVLMCDIVEKEHSENNNGKDKSITQKFEAMKYFDEVYTIVFKMKLTMSGKDTEVNINNKTMVLTKGKAALSINVYLEPSWGAQAEKTPLKRFIVMCYHKFLGKDTKSRASSLAIDDANNIIRRFKTYANATIK